MYVDFCFVWMDSCYYGWQMDLTRLDLNVYNAISTVATSVYYQTCIPCNDSQLQKMETCVLNVPPTMDNIHDYYLCMCWFYGLLNDAVSKPIQETSSMHIICNINKVSIKYKVMVRETSLGSINMK